MKTLSLIPLLIAVVLIAAIPSPVAAEEFASHWPAQIERPWAGPEYWTNPLPDWRVRNGRLECWRGGGDRNVYLLTRRMGESGTELYMEVSLGRLDPAAGPLDEGWAGFRVGAAGAFDNYGDDVLYGVGMPVGVTTDGRLFIGGPARSGPELAGKLDNLTLRLTGRLEGDRWLLRLEALDGSGALLASTERDDIHPDWLEGSLGLVCSRGEPRRTRWSSPRRPAARLRGAYPVDRTEGGNVLFWFTDWKVGGDKPRAHEERAWGPVLFSCHTLSRGVLKLTAQLAPVGNNTRTVSLEADLRGDGSWESLGEQEIDGLSRTATFRIPDWDGSRRTAYRVSYRDMYSGEVQYSEGAIAAEPVDKEEIVVAVFACSNDYGFPHRDMVRYVKAHKPDLLAFTGDQIYEATGGYYVLRSRDVELATLDYLRRWYMWGWEFGSLIRDLPAICMPDDHDMFQGNIWGAGGVPAWTGDITYAEAQDNGGYCMPPEWVNMVHRTQTDHLPDPYDPEPIAQGIAVYYTDLLYGGLSLAIVEDRKWKSSPKAMLPDANVINGWAQNPDYDAARDGDVPGAKLLGDRQLEFLEHWAADWSGGAWFKAVVSQTLWANVATLPAPATGDDIVPDLSILPPGEYAEGDMIVQDHDSDGWPQTGRNEALRRMRKGFAIHMVGDTHLGSTIQYGIDSWRDGPYAICVPAVANIWPRRWYPPEPGRNREPGKPRNTGDYLDGFGNKMTVFTVANPTAVEIEPQWINHRSPGYGIVRFDRGAQTATLAVWPRWVDPAQPGAEPFAGWPITCSQLDNYGGEAAGELPEIRARGLEDPVVQLIDQDTGDIVYTLRIKGNSFSPPVYREGEFTVRIGDPDRGSWREFTGLTPGGDEGRQVLEAEF